MKLKRILIIDDDNETCKLLKSYLSDKYEIFIANDEETARKFLNEKDFHLIALNIYLSYPSTTGIELLKEIKEKNPLTQVIAIAAHETLDTVVKALKLGAFDYILKPINPEEFTNKVEKALLFQRTYYNHRFLENALELYRYLEILTKTEVSEEKFLNLILKRTLESIDAHSGSILIYNEDTQTLHLKTSIGLGEKITRVLKLGERIAGKVAKEKKSILLHNGLSAYDEFKHLPTRPEIASSMCVPLLLENQLVGVLCLNRLNTYPRKFTELELENIEMFATHISIAIGEFRGLHMAIKYQELKSLFLTSVSHELRTPLMSLKGALELLAESGIDVKNKELLEIANRNVNKMALMINNLLDYSRFEKGRIKLKKEKFAIKKLLDEIISDFKDTADSKSLKLEACISSSVTDFFADRLRIKQALSNLLDNAFKFTDKGYVKINVDRKDNNLLISVEDTGCGIPEEERDRIFDMYYGKAEDFSKGIGLGLAIVKSIVDLHNGKIWLKSEPSKGSTFYISLPIEKA